jgi:ribose 5-phosphate isomerase B
MNVAIGADHGGFDLKEKISVWLSDNGHNVKDFGCESTESVDYPQFGASVARSVAVGESELGILVCGSGVGMSMTANKIPGIRAALCNDAVCAEYSRRHNDANVLAMGGRVVAPDKAIEIVQIFLTSRFEGGRHARRVDQIMDLEKEWRKD